MHKEAFVPILEYMAVLLWEVIRNITTISKAVIRTDALCDSGNTPCSFVPQ
jgi:hypothetical protein